MRYLLPRTLILTAMMMACMCTDSYANDTTITTSIYAEPEDKVEWDWSNWQEVVYDCNNYLALKKNEKNKNSKTITYRVSNLN